MTDNDDNSQFSTVIFTYSGASCANGTLFRSCRESLPPGRSLKCSVPYATVVRAATTVFHYSKASEALKPRQCPAWYTSPVMLPPHHSLANDTTNGVHAVKSMNRFPVSLTALLAVVTTLKVGIIVLPRYTFYNSLCFILS